MRRVGWFGDSRWMTGDDGTVQAVLTELGWESNLDATRVRVLAEEGVVFLRGRVRSFAEKLAASRAALRASGVLYVHNQLEIVLRLQDRMSDDDLRRAVLLALRLEPHAPNGLVAVAVSRGHVTLRGVVDHPLQIDASAAAVRRLPGVVGVSNQLSLRGCRPVAF